MLKLTGVPMLEITNVDTKHFDETFKELVLYNKRSIPEIIDRNAYFVARDWVRLTVATPKDRIKSDLGKPSRVSPTLSIGELLANKVRTSAGQKGLYGNKLRIAGNKYARQRSLAANFLRSGGIPAIKELEKFVPKKGGAPSYPSAVKVSGRPKGGGVGAPLNGGSWLAKASIWNAVQGGFKKWAGAPGRNIFKVQTILINGLQAAVNNQESKNREYIEKKINAGVQQFNKS